MSWLGSSVASGLKEMTSALKLSLPFLRRMILTGLRAVAI